MENRSLSCVLWLSTLLQGLAALLYSFYWGLVLGQGLGSSLWLSVTGIAFCLWLGFLLIGGFFHLKHTRIFPLNLIQEKLAAPDGRLQCMAVFIILGLASFEFVLLSFMFLPTYFRWFALWGILLGIQGWLLLRVQPGSADRSDGWKLPNISRFSQSQKRVMWILSAILALNFILMIPTNLYGTEDAGRFLATGEDEVVIYPILTTMYQPADDFRLSLYRWIEYDDYHYGYPFYVFSALVVLPSRIISGPEFGSHYRMNLLLLRQFVSVLPLLLSAFLITYLATRFRSLTISIMILLLILTIPAVVRYERAFWHPDALALLFVVLTLFFLDRDRLRFGNDFYLAAVCCGLASAIRLVGFFFFLSVAGYLLVGWMRGKSFGRIVSAGAGFLALMCMAILLANPYMFDAGARGRMSDILSQKSYEMANGYGDPDPHAIYQTGWETWLPFLAKDFAPPWFVGFLLLSTAAAAVFDRRSPFPALLLGWVVAMGGYLIYFVAVKSYQYGLPVFVPLMGSVAFLPEMLKNMNNVAFQHGFPQKFLTGAVHLFFLVQCILNINAIVRL
jgi:hypothetical protein